MAALTPFGMNQKKNTRLAVTVLKPPLDVDFRKVQCIYDFTASKGTRNFVPSRWAAFSQAVTFYVVSPPRPRGDVGTCDIIF
jgi:hypothetical protein